MAEPNDENCMKIRPAEVKIKGLTQIVKKEIIIRRRNNSKTYGLPGNYHDWMAKLGRTILLKGN